MPVLATMLLLRFAAVDAVTMLRVKFPMVFLIMGSEPDAQTQTLSAVCDSVHFL